MELVDKCYVTEGATEPEGMLQRILKVIHVIVAKEGEKTEARSLADKESERNNKSN